MPGTSPSDEEEEEAPLKIVEDRHKCHNCGSNDFEEISAEHQGEGVCLMCLCLIIINCIKLTGSQATHVCLNCGEVSKQSSSLIKHDVTQNDGLSSCKSFLSGIQNPPMHIKNSKSSFFRKKEIRKTAEILSSQLSFSPDMKLQLKQYLDECLYTKDSKYYYSKFQTKKTIVGICGYLVSRQTNRGVTIDKICQQLNLTKDKFCSDYYDYIKNFRHERHSSDDTIHQMLPGIISEYHLISESDSECDNKKLADQIIHLTPKLFKLMDSIYTDIKVSEPILTALSFHSYKHLGGKKTRQLMLNSHLLRFNLPKHRTLETWVTRMGQRFIEMANTQYTLKMYNLNKQTISLYLNEILDMSDSIIRDMISQMRQDNLLKRKSCGYDDVVASKDPPKFTDMTDEQIDDEIMKSCIIRTPDEVQRCIQLDERMKKLKKDCVN